MEEINVRINRIQKEIEDIGEQLAIISEIIIDFSDASEWDTAREKNKSNKIDTVWKKRKPYLNSPFQKLAEEEGYLWEKDNLLREEKNHLLQKKIQLIVFNRIEKGSDTSIYLFFVNTLKFLFCLKRRLLERRGKGISLI